MGGKLLEPRPAQKKAADMVRARYEDWTVEELL